MYTPELFSPVNPLQIASNVLVINTPQVNIAFAIKIYIKQFKLSFSHNTRKVVTHESISIRFLSLYFSDKVCYDFPEIG